MVVVMFFSNAPGLEQLQLLPLYMSNALLRLNIYEVHLNTDIYRLEDSLSNVCKSKSPEYVYT